MLFCDIMMTSYVFVLGILLMMSLCREVSVYEFIPSVRRSELCHYYERYHDAACTWGAYHPLLYEKLLVQRINGGRRDQLRTKGKVTLRGFSTVQCGSWSWSSVLPSGAAGTSDEFQSRSKCCCVTVSLFPSCWKKKNHILTQKFSEFSVLTSFFSYSFIKVILM